MSNAIIYLPSYLSITIMVASWSSIPFYFYCMLHHIFFLSSLSLSYFLLSYLSLFLFLSLFLHCFTSFYLHFLPLPFPIPQKVLVVDTCISGPGECIEVDNTSVVIQVTQESDSGTYTCVAENEAGTATHEVRILVQPQASMYHNKN